MKFFSKIISFFSNLFSKIGGMGKSKHPALDNFYETIHKNAFPGGDKQIDEEVAALKLLMSDTHSKESIRSLLLYATAKLYFRALHSDRFDSNDLIRSIVISKKVSHQDATHLCNLLIMKFTDTNLNG